MDQGQRNCLDGFSNESVLEIMHSKLSRKKKIVISIYALE